MAESSLIRPCAVCGLFYPDDPEELSRTVTSLMEDAAPRKEQEPKIRGLIVPHAGYMYSGRTAARAYARLQGVRYGTVVIVSPSHHEFFEGISVFPGTAYRTPLGDIPVDHELRQELLKRCPHVKATTQGQMREHAIEVQLPFLQMTIGAFSLLPLVMGTQTHELCSDLGAALGALIKDRDCLLVASTDLSHYYPAAVAERLDRRIIDDVERLDEHQLMRDLEERKTEACGGGPTVAVLTALRSAGITGMEILHYETSGDVTGDYRSVVGYLSAAASS